MMSMEYNIPLEKDLKKLGFKKRWFSDRSGWWMIKPFKYNDLDLNIYVEIDNKMLILQAKTGMYRNHKITMNKYYDDVKQYKLTLENVKKLIKTYK